MKRTILLMLLLCFCIVRVHAIEFTVNGIKYQTIGSSTNVKVVANNYSGIVYIPEYAYYQNVSYLVTTVGSDAFSGCSELTYVSFSNALTTIESGAFRDCVQLTSFSTNKIESIANLAFQGCSALTTVYIGPNVRSMNNLTFDGCSNLESFVNYSNNPRYQVVDNVLYNSYLNQIVAVPEGIRGNVVIPNGITSIPDNMFNGRRNLSSVIIPNSVTSIGTYAFASCVGLSSIQIPGSVRAIGDYAFFGCSGITSYDVDINNQYYSSYNGLLFNKAATKLLGYPCGLTATHFDVPEFVVPSVPITEIGTGAFGMSHLHSVSFSKNITTIGQDAFTRSYDLEYIEIPSTLTSIRDYAFYYCTGIKYVVLYNNTNLNFGYSVFENCSNSRIIYNLTSINIPRGSTSYGCLAQNGTVIQGMNIMVWNHSHSNENGNVDHNITSENAMIQVSETVSADKLPINFLSRANAREIVIKDGADPLYVPYEFTTNTISYTRSYEQGNRSTICLPFKPATVNGSSTTNLKFYEFAGFDGTTITFNEVDFEDLAANTPYMVEWPALKTAQDFVFGATEATIPATGDAASRTVEHGNGKFIGTMERTHMNSTNYYGYKNGYFVQSRGGQAEDAHAHVNPFRAYFQITPSNAQGFTMPTEISVRFNTAEDNVGIDSVEPQQSNIHYSNDVYDMMGRMVRKNAENLDGLRKGVYIWKGEKKVVF